MVDKLELFGLPCSGKTTYINLNFLSQEIGFSDSKPIVSRVLGAMIEVVKSPTLFMLVISTFIHVPPKLFVLHSKGIFRFYSRMREIRIENATLKVLEEGYFQAFWGLLMLMEINDKSLKVATDILSVSKFEMREVIYTYSSKNVIVYRNIIRKKSTRFSFLLIENNEKLISQSRTWMSVILRSLKRKGLIRRIEFSK